MTMSRRAFLKATGLVTGAAAIPLVNPVAVLAQSEKHGGLLRVSVTFGLSTLNPIMHISGAEWIATKWMYNNLTRLNAKRELVPDLAESWTAADGAKTPHRPVKAEITLLTFVYRPVGSPSTRPP